MLFWIVRSPANYYFHWLRAVTHQSNVNRYLSQGRTSVIRDATLRYYCHDINQNGEDEGKYWEGVEFAKYTERKEGDYSERRTREGVVELLSGKDVLAILPTGFGKSLISTIFAFGEHRFAVCEDVCVSHLHSILHFSCTDIWRPPRVHGLKNIYRCNRWIFEEIAKFLFQIITTKSTHVAGGSFFESWPVF